MQQDPTARKRFIREARSAAALDHPYICHINEVGESDGQDFIVMEYVDSQSLKDRLVQGPLTLEDALQITIEVAEALEAAHGKGIIHRDIKPGNILCIFKWYYRAGSEKRLPIGRGNKDAWLSLVRDGCARVTARLSRSISPEVLSSDDHRLSRLAFEKAGLQLKAKRDMSAGQVVVFEDIEFR